MATFVHNTGFVVEDCCNCGMQFALTQDFYRRVYEKHTTFYCPKGHGQNYSGKTETQKLKEQLAAAEQEAHRAKLRAEEQAGKAIAAIGQLNDLKRAATKMRKRIRNGVCPCCTRTFQNLMGHMKTEHPEFGDIGELRVVRDLFGLSQTALAQEIGVPAGYVSQFERGKYVPYHGKKKISNWLEQQA